MRCFFVFLRYITDLVLFDIFDIDDSGALNQSQLDLFLSFVLDITPIDVDSNHSTEGTDAETNTNTNMNPNTLNAITTNSTHSHSAKKPSTAISIGSNSSVTVTAASTVTMTGSHIPLDSSPIDVESIVDRTQYIEYLRRLISPHKASAPEPAVATEVADHKGNDEEEAVVVGDGDAATDQSPAEWEQIPMHDDSDSAPIDFLTVSLKSLMAADTATLSDSIHKVLAVKLFRKHKLLKADFVGFAAESLRCERLLASFMIIPTRHDEKRIIGELMQSTEMTLGSSWYAIC